ncbi:MAG TPA: flagellar basal body-associated FliL family protein [Candidatus Treponema faecavium]|nr:flagellar basal body-associated FliL family protein [Candidatus Treponema faecavium]
MADEDLDMGEETTSTAPAKKGLMGGFLPMLLKWIAIAIGAIIVIVTVVVITLNVMGGNTTAQQTIPIAEEYSGRRETLDWFQAVGTIRTRTSDAVPASVMVEVVLGYRKEDKAASTEITERLVEIKDFLRRYFTEKTAAELQPMNEEKLKIEIRNAINDDILSNSKIRDVRFLSLEVIEQ